MVVVFAALPEFASKLDLVVTEDLLRNMDSKLITMING